jgi:hypothetical protein
VHPASVEKSDDSKYKFYEKLEQGFYHFPKYHMKTQLGDFKAKLRSEDIFKMKIGYDNLYQISNDNGVKIINFATPKI